MIRGTWPAGVGRALRRTRATAFALAAPAASSIAGCSGRQSPLDPAGDQTGGVLSLLQLMGWVCGIAYLCVVGFLGWSLWRARGRLRGADRRRSTPPTRR